LVKKQKKQAIIGISSPEIANIAYTMCSNFLKKNNLSGKSLLLTGVYLLHFILFQSFVAGFSNSHFSNTKTFFSGTHKSTNPNSGIATFRTLEKHDASHQTLKFPRDFRVSVLKPFNTGALIDGPVDLAFIPASFHFSDASYRLYVRDCVFLI
jgi:hypothetical protein